MNKGILALGPFIGSFEQEILTFRPHMRWIEVNSDSSAVYYSSHFNRKFLYPQIPPRKYFPVYKQLTRQEIHQVGYSHRDVDQKDFVSLTRIYKDSISEKAGCVKKNINQQSLPYVKYIPPISIYHKIFEPIKVPISKKKGYVVFIPDETMPEEDAKRVFEYLRTTCKFSIIGDMKCHLPDDNEILQGLDYLNTGYEKIMTAITNSAAVITPCSHWTAIANLQGVPVISWGENIGQYRDQGIYHFNNFKSRTVFHESSSDLNNIIRQIDRYLREVS